MTREKAQEFLRYWAHEAQMQYTVFAGFNGLILICILIGFYRSEQVITMVILTTIFTALTLFCWLKGRGKWGSNYKEQVESWMANPESITHYKSKLINKGGDIEISEDFSSYSEAVYKVTLYFSDQTQTSIKVTKRDQRKFIPALKVLFPQLNTSASTQKKTKKTKKTKKKTSHTKEE